MTRVLLNLSRGGADATHLREFDLLTESFVDADGEEQGFTLPEGKTRASYKSRDTLIIGADTGEGSMTSSGYPRTAREWKRGTKIEDAPVVFEGEETDVSCGQYIYDQTYREGGAMYEVQSRSVTFYNSIYNVRKDPEGEFVKLAIDLKTNVEFCYQMKATTTTTSITSHRHLFRVLSQFSVTTIYCHQGHMK